MIPPAALAAGQTFYPERPAAREPALDKLLAQIGYWLERATGRHADDPAAFAAAVRSHARGFAGGPLAPRVAQIRYRLRKEGLSREPLAECLGLCSAALAPRDPEAIAPRVLEAAAQLVEGRIAELPGAREREQALVIAAAALAVHGTPVHVLAASDARAARLAALLEGPLAALGMDVGCVSQQMPTRERRDAYGAQVACAAQRVLATDYLRDRMQLGRRRGAIRGRLERLAGDAPAAGQLMLRGLHCALVEDADGVLLDEALAPVVLAAEMEPSLDRLQCEQALELARALRPESDFELVPEGVALTETGSQRLAHFARPLGAAWAERDAREGLCAAALEALHVLERGRDYRVEQGRVLFPQADAGPDDPVADIALRRALVEIKEGCKLSGQRELLARLSMPRFFGRYLHLAGTCADARGLEADFWSLYLLKTRSLARLSPLAPCPARVFTTTAARRAALLDTARDLVDAGGRVLIALRTPAESQAVQADLASLERQEAVAMTLYPAHRDAQGGAGDGAAPHLLVAELHDAARNVRQIREAYGARSCTVFLAIEDEPVAATIGRLRAALGRRRAQPDGELPARVANTIATRAQRGVERLRSAQRRDAAARERQLEDLLAFSGEGD